MFPLKIHCEVLCDSTFPVSVHEEMENAATEPEPEPHAARHVFFHI